MPTTSKCSVFEFKLVGKSIIHWKINGKCNQSYTLGFEVKQMLFNAMVKQVLHYGVEVWGDTIPLNAWNDIEKLQKMFEGDKFTVYYNNMLLESYVQHIELFAYREYIETLQKSRIHQIIGYNVFLGMLDLHYKIMTIA